MVVVVADTPCVTTRSAPATRKGEIERERGGERVQRELRLHRGGGATVRQTDRLTYRLKDRHRYRQTDRLLPCTRMKTTMPM